MKTKTFRRKKQGKSLGRKLLSLLLCVSFLSTSLPLQAFENPENTGAIPSSFVAESCQSDLLPSADKSATALESNGQSARLLPFSGCQQAVTYQSDQGATFLRQSAASICQQSAGLDSQKLRAEMQNAQNLLDKNAALILTSTCASHPQAKAYKQVLARADQELTAYQKKLAVFSPYTQSQPQQPLAVNPVPTANPLPAYAPYPPPTFYPLPPPRPSPILYRATHDDNSDSQQQTLALVLGAGLLGVLLLNGGGNKDLGGTQTNSPPSPGSQSSNVIPASPPQTATTAPLANNDTAAPGGPANNKTEGSAPAPVDQAKTPAIPAAGGAPMDSSGGAQVNYTTRGGARKSAAIAASFQKPMQCVVDAIRSLNYAPNEIVCFSSRPNNASAHPTGHACDIDQTSRDVTGLTRVVNKSQQVALTRNCGEVISGCIWGNPDCGHYEQRSAGRNFYSPAGASVNRRYQYPDMVSRPVKRNDG